MFKTLANRNRRAILRILRDTGEATAAEIAAKINLSHTSTKKNLGILEAAHLITSAGTVWEARFRLSGRRGRLARTILNQL